MKTICPFGSDGAHLVTVGYNPPAVTAPESYDWWVASLLLDNLEELLPERPDMIAEVRRARQKLALLQWSMED